MELAGAPAGGVGGGWGPNGWDRSCQTYSGEQRRAECSSFVGRKEQAESEIQDSRSRIERLQHDREQVNAQAADLLVNQQAQEIEIGVREEKLRAQRGKLTESQQQRGAIEIELAQKNMSVQNLRERVQQKYHVSLDSIRSECITITVADEGPPKVETLTPEEMAAYLEAAIEEAVDLVLARLDLDGAIRDVFIFVEDRAEIRIERVDSSGSSSDEPKKLGQIFVERSMFVSFDGSSITGIPAPARTWLFAEGATYEVPPTGDGSVYPVQPKDQLLLPYIP